MTLSLVSFSLSYFHRFYLFITTLLYWFAATGGHSEDHEDAQEDHQCSPADRAGGDPEEHVPALQEADQGADRVVDRAQVHAA